VAINAGRLKDCKLITNNMFDLTNLKTMTSRELAELTGKDHKNMLRTIRSMELAWEKVNGRKFELVKYTDAKGEQRVQYVLTKIECLYTSTKFNNEITAKLVKRWQELENEKLEKKKPALDLSDPDKVLRLA